MGRAEAVKYPYSGQVVLEHLLRELAFSRETIREYPLCCGHREQRAVRQTRDSDLHGLGRLSHVPNALPESGFGGSGPRDHQMMLARDLYLNSSRLYHLSLAHEA